MWVTSQRTVTEKVEWMRKSFSCSTFTHPPVLTQHVACGTFTLVRAHNVHTAEGTEKRVLCALVDVWTKSRRKPVAVGVEDYKHCIVDVRVRLWFHIPSQVIIGPGSKPSSHAHSKPPMTLVHVPLPQGLPMSHSLVSVLKKVTWTPLNILVLESHIPAASLQKMTWLIQSYLKDR